ncbi:MAG: tripartite tricarboxylate transporter permease [Clostridiaceae bacterium]|nr:tripartite tricarboxylate transporter permease [Clostridiaceae bacterium]
MKSLTLLGQGILTALNPMVLLLMAVGVGVGIVFGSIPGLSAVMAVALFLPMTFGLDPSAGMCLLVALYIGAVSGGLIAAILLNIPGTPSSIATCFDGSPMARRGEAGKALGVGIVFSFIGGLVSFIALSFLAPPIAKVALNFQAAENFAVCVFALTMIATISGDSILKGVLSGMLGLLLAMVGLAPIDNVPRYTFGFYSLSSGFDTLPTLIGIFAVAEVLNLAEEVKKMSRMKPMELKPIKGFGFSMSEFKSQIPNAARSSLLGLGIGILPGIGGSVSGIMSYITAKNSSKNPEKFGTGCIDGIVASETANNATIGGALIPLLALGIPGDGVTAMLLGAFMIHGLQPGPLLFTNRPDLVYTIFAACIIANFIMLALEFLGIRGFVRLLTVPKHILMPIIMVLCAIGAFAANKNVFDVKSLILFGILGYLMSKFKIPAAPFILAFILGGNVETYLRKALMNSKGNFSTFVTSPISCVFLLIAGGVLIFSFVKEMKKVILK